MLIGRQRLDWISRVAFLLLLLCSVGGCTRTYTWTEEVTLKSGEKLVVGRKQKYDSSGGEWASATRWNTLREARIRIDGVPVEWVGKNYPMILEQWQGGYVIVYIKGACYAYGKEDPRRYVPPYIVEAFINGRWQEIDVLQVNAVWPRNLVFEWRDGGRLEGDGKTRKLRSERIPTGGAAEAYDLSLPSGCGPIPSIELRVGE